MSYWSVAVYGGLAFGPALGDFLRGNDRYELTFFVSAALAFVAATLGVFTREVPRAPAEPRRGPLWHPAALRPGFVLFLGLMPLSAFAPLIVSVNILCVPDELKMEMPGLRRVMAATDTWRQ